MRIQLGTREITAGRVFCIGRNYARHARELGNAAPARPIVFMKPPDSLVPEGTLIPLPSHGRDLHFETELVVLIGSAGPARTPREARERIAGLSLGFDLTLRDVQDDLKAKGLPWELAKAFEGSAPLGRFVACEPGLDLGDIRFRGLINGAVRQEGWTGDMIFPVETLVTEIARVWAVKPGDMIYTGTPEGVGPLQPGDTLTADGERFGSFTWTLADKRP